MSRLRANPVRAKATLGAVLLTLVAAAAACDEDGKTAPERCVDPPPYDIQAGAPDDIVQNPCATPVGHAINQGPTRPGPSATAGSGGKGGGTATADAGAGGTATANAGAGGAP